MANHLDLEEQEQLDQLKHFWKQYGNLISWALIVVCGAIAAWNAYQYWQRKQAAQAQTLFEQVEKVAAGSEMEKLAVTFGEMKTRFPATTYAWQAGLLVAKVNHVAGKIDDAKAALQWVADEAKDVGYADIARLRLSSVLIDAKAYDDALGQLGTEFSPEFAPLVADRKGDVFVLQGKTENAKAEYQKAFVGFAERPEFQRLIEMKLNALGVNPQPMAVGAK